MFLGQTINKGEYGDLVTVYAPPSGGPLVGNKNGSVTPNGGWISTLTQTAGGVLQIVNQQRLMNENLERARQGMDPLTYSDVPGMVPTMQFGVEENTRNSGLMLVALGVGAFLLLNMSGGRSRSED